MRVFHDFIRGDGASHPSDEDLSPGTPASHPSDEDLSPGTPVSGAYPAVWASHAGLQTLVAAVGTRHQETLRTGKDIDQEAQEVQEEDHQHPENRVVHAARLGVAGHPHQQGDTQRQEDNGNEEEGAAAAAAGAATGRVPRIALRETGNRDQQAQDCQWFEKELPGFHGSRTFRGEVDWQPIIGKASLQVNRKKETAPEGR